VIPELDPMTQAFMVGFFGCLFSVAPVALLVSITCLQEDANWGLSPQGNRARARIAQLESENKELREDLSISKSVIDSFIIAETIRGQESSTDQGKAKEDEGNSKRGVPRKRKVHGS